MAQTSQDVIQIFKDTYENWDGKVDYNAATDALNVIMRSGTDYLTPSREHFFALKTRRGQTTRTYGLEDPFTFDTCSAPPDWEPVCLSYKISYTPYSFTNLLAQESRPSGSMVDVIASSIEDTLEQAASDMERQFLTGDGRNILFVLDGTEDFTDPAAVLYGIKWYGGRDGEDIGLIAESLNICGLDIQAASACGVAPRATNNASGDNTLQIVGMDPTFGNEQMIVNGRITAFADGDVIYQARRDNNGIQGCTDGRTGLPLLMDDFTEAEEFQCLTEDDCGTFKATVMNEGLAPQDLTEVMLSRAVTFARIRQPRSRKEKISFKGYMFFANPTQTRKFANLLTAERMLTAPSMWSSAGIVPKYGVQIDALAFDGIPWVESQLAFNNTVFLGPVENIVQVHNGPAEGQMMKTPDGNTWTNVPCSPRFTMAHFIINDFGVRSRKGMVQIKNLTAWDI